MLSTGKTTGQDLTNNHRSLIGLLTRRRQTLNRAQNLCHPLGLIGKQKCDLCANNLTRRLAMRSPLLARNRTPTSLEYKLVKVLAAHKLGDTLAKLNLAIPKGLDLCLESTDLVVNANPSAEGVADLVSHLGFTQTVSLKPHLRRS